jgi:hypothetical protein
MSAFGGKADMAQTRRNARLIEDRGRDAADWLGLALAVCSSTQMTRAIFVDVSAAISITVGEVFRNVAGVIRDRVGIGDNNIGQNMETPSAPSTATCVIATVPTASIAAAVTVVRESNRGQQRDCQGD